MKYDFRFRYSREKGKNSRVKYNRNKEISR